MDSFAAYQAVMELKANGVEVMNVLTDLAKAGCTVICHILNAPNLVILYDTLMILYLKII